MVKRYDPAPAPRLPRQGSAQVITNDLYLAAFLHCVGCALDRVERNERRRVSFVFTGERVAELREAYRTGPVRLDMRCFRESLSHIRRLTCAELGRGMDAEQRSLSHVPAAQPALQLVSHT